ncbi:hypothetical protein GCM10011331_24640 [Flavimobilis marinus]|uniref:Uncharacterized protein n=1 Tax=Flavimobilis marinus TaxID=285351 RepID=A0A1I2HMU3_9MICO|nr:hypothetical protein GCM10011331_24640 [Flavimobilis marinus]SFF30620.1 hypothetical protein SAMN04488035_2430 [Flavimobilis marinus]
MTVLRRVVGVLLVVLGLAAIAVATASATIWRPSDVVTARAAASDVAMMTTAPGVLDLVGDEVTLTARARDGAPVALVLGDERDVAGWVGADPVVEITGLESWTTLATQAGDAGDGDPTPAEEGLPDPTASDMWIASARGEGTASLTWDAPAGRVQALVVVPGADGVSPELELSWPREVSTPLLVPGVVAGAILLLVGAAVLVRELLRARRRRTAVEPDSAAATTPPAGVPSRDTAPAGSPAPGIAVPGDDSALAAGPAAAGTVSAAARSAMTRRELRELAEREAAEREAAEKAARAAERRARPRTGMLPAVRRATSTGPTPQVPEPQETPTAPETAAQPSSPEATRADAWRQAWGFGETSWAPYQPDRDTESAGTSKPAADEAPAADETGGTTAPPTSTGGAR